MKKLNLLSINSRAPYHVQQRGNEGRYDFKTDHGVHYIIDFMEDDLLQSAVAYQLSIINVNHVNAPRDIKVRDTIIAVVDSFFEQNKTALLYICETSDGRQSLRNRLFMSWFESDEHKNDFVIITTDIIDAEGVYNYAAIIVPLDAPKFEEIIKEYKTTVLLLKNKP